MRRALLLLAAAAAPTASAAQQWGMADGVYGAEAMRRSRAAVVEEHGGMRHGMALADRLEYRREDGGDGALADLEGWWGTDEHRLWLKAEIERDFDRGEFKEARIEALYSRPVAPFIDLQAGVRVDAAGEGRRTWAVLGAEGLAPYFIHVDGALYVSGRGEVAARLEGTTDVLLTQRLILQPRVELAFAAQDIPGARVGAGLSSADAGLRLRYEIRRSFAPYVGVSWERDVGAAADLARAAGDDAGAVAFVAGVRAWF